MRFVNNDVLPRDLLQMRLFHQAHFVRRNTDFKVDWFDARLDKLRLDRKVSARKKHNIDTMTYSRLLVPVEDESIEIRHPLVELILPVMQGGFGDDD